MLNNKSAFAVLLAIVLLAFLLRTLGQLDTIFVDGAVLFRGIDSDYHMRLVDWMLANWPRYLDHDSYACYPSGGYVGYGPLLAWLIVGFSHLLTFGHATQYTVDIVGAWLPPVLGSLTLIPVYFIGKEAFGSKTVGLTGALFVGILPTEFFHRSLLGFTDHHILEVLLTACTLLFIMKSERNALYGMLAGACLGLLHLAWHGAMLLNMTLLCWYVLSQWREWNKPRSVAIFLTFLVSYIIAAPYLPNAPDGAMKAYSMLACVGVVLWVRWQECGIFVWPRKWRYGALNIALPLVGLAVLCWRSLYVRQVLKDNIGAVFFGWGATIEEALPPSFEILAAVFVLALPLAVIGVFIYIKHKPNTLFLVWSFVMAMAYLGQRRWGYYAVIPVALYAACCIDWVAGYVGKDWRKYVAAFLCVMVALSGMYGISGLARLPNDVSMDWYRTCLWLRDNTPEPYGDTNAYCGSPEGKPEYGVLSWWDYGNSVIRYGRRIPVTTPSWQDTTMFVFFLAQTPEEADTAIAGKGIKYVIVDRAMVAEKFYAIIYKVYARYGYSFSGELQPSMAYRLYYGQVGGYRLVHIEGEVKVFEVID